MSGHLPKYVPGKSIKTLSYRVNTLVNGLVCGVLSYNAYEQIRYGDSDVGIFLIVVTLYVFTTWASREAVFRQGWLSAFMFMDEVLENSGAVSEDGRATLLYLGCVNVPAFRRWRSDMGAMYRELNLLEQPSTSDIMTVIRRHALRKARNEESPE